MLTFDKKKNKIIPVMVDKAKENRDFTKGSLIKKILIYFIPLYLSNALQLLFTTMDLFTVTHFGGGNTSSGAIGATNNLINIILCVFWGITSGVSVVIANAKGGKEVDKVTRAIGSSILIMIICGFLVMLFGILFSKRLLILLETDPVFLDKSNQYLLIYFLGAPFNLLYTTGAAILRAFGDTRRPFVAVAISGIINICLNFFFVIVCRLDVAGVAIATITSQAISMVIVFYYLTRDKRLTANFDFKYLKIYKEEALDILRIGLASGLQGFIFNFTNVYIQRCTNVLGPEAVIGKAASSNVEGYEYALVNTISQTCTVAVSQNYGGKKKKRMSQSLWACIFLELLVVTVFDSIVLLLHKPLISVFIASGEETTEAAFALALQSLIIIGLPYALCGIPECFTGYLRGMKYSIVPTIVSLICIVGCRMIFIWFMFDQPYFHSFTWLIATYPLSWILCALVYIPVTLIMKKKKYQELPAE